MQAGRATSMSPQATRPASGRRAIELNRRGRRDRRALSLTPRSPGQILLSQRRRDAKSDARGSKGALASERIRARHGVPLSLSLGPPCASASLRLCVGWLTERRSRTRFQRGSSSSKHEEVPTRPLGALGDLGGSRQALLAHHRGRLSGSVPAIRVSPSTISSSIVTQIWLCSAAPAIRPARGAIRSG